MKMEFYLRGLNCPNCAAKIEGDVKSLPNISYAECSAVNSRLILDASDSSFEEIEKIIKKIVHKYEDDVEVEFELKKQNLDLNFNFNLKEFGKQIIEISLGLLIFIAAVIFHKAAFSDYMFLAAYAIVGWKIVFKALKKILKGQLFDENFLMSIATLGAIVIGEYPEAVAVMLFYLTGELFQEMAVKRSRKSISDLMDIRPDYANIKRDGIISRINPKDLEPGDIIVIKPGEKVPADGVVTEGFSALDVKALTGESVPKNIAPSDSILSGSVNQSGVLTVEVQKTYNESTAAKIINLVENASSKKAPTENFITTFSKYYTPAVVGAAALLAIIPSLIYGGGWEVWSEWLRRAFIFLVISCPCALVVSIPLGFFGGIGNASKRGVLVKGGNFLEALSKLEIVVFDKTGTLTKGVFEVRELYPADGFSKEELLELAAVAEAFSNHPIAVSISEAYNKNKINKNKISDYKEIQGHGTSAVLDGTVIFAGNEKLMQKENIAFQKCDLPGTKIYIAANGKYAGCILISDEIKDGSPAAISGLKSRGIRKTVMLTGDDAKIAEATAEKLNLDEVHAQLLPAQKVEIVENLMTQKNPKKKLAFMGDGINDAPVLSRADIGIAMGGLGADAAIEAADVVLMTDEPAKLNEAIDVAKKTKQIVWQNIILALGVKFFFLTLGVLGISGMWEAVFADVGISLIAILNSLRILRFSKNI